MTVSDEWAGCYSANWVGVIQEDSFAHPAKYSRALIQRIYAHLAECGAIWPGAVVLDPFGGVGLGALDAMFHGCQWVGVELERRFHQLGLENICLWNERYKGWPGWGRATLLNGDSRRLREVVQGADCVVSSPPYATDQVNNHNGIDRSKMADGRPGGKNSQAGARDYGQTPGQLGNLKEGDFAAVVASPPYAESNVTGERNFTGGGGNETPASSLRKGQVAAVVSSPPYAECGIGNNQRSFRNNDGRPTPRFQKDLTAEEKSDVGYGTSAGQLGAMKDAGFDAVVSSPPWEKGAEGGLRGEKFKDVEAFAAGLQANDGKDNRHGCSVEARVAQLKRDAGKIYGNSEGQLGTEQGDTFWTAARQIVTECYHLLRPGGAAVWVTKGFVRKKTYVDFPGQWRQLCEAVGFQTIHEHRAMLVTDAGEQGMLFDEPEQLVKARKSFFRRLAEKKGSPAIDFECVHCMTKRAP